MKNLLLFLLPLLAAAWLLPLGGCKKCKGVDGSVLEYGTNTPIASATVILSDCSGEILGNFTCIEKARTTANGGGDFSFKEHGVSLSAEATDYWPSGDDAQQFYGDCPDPVTLHLYPNATLQVTLKNESGAYGFSYGNQIRKLVKGEQKTFTSIERGNTVFTLVFDVLLSETETVPPPTTVKILINDVEQIPEFNNLTNWVYFTPSGHETTKVSIIY